MDNAKQSFAAYAASDRTDAVAEQLAGDITAVAANLPDRKQRASWANGLGAIVAGREYRFDAKAGWFTIHL